MQKNAWLRTPFPKIGKVGFIDTKKYKLIFQAIKQSN